MGARSEIIVDLIGFDVGFSKTRRTSGVARLRGELLSCDRATSEWGSREKVLGSGTVDFIAIDGPILKDTDHPQRLCETVFSRGLFGRRCKPAFSHVPGTGRTFRIATKETAECLANFTRAQDIEYPFPKVMEGKNIVEAFPNAFLGVLVADSQFREMPQLKRGKKFDWLYDQCRQAKLFQPLVNHMGIGSLTTVAASIQANRDHEERAALVCLLTAAAVAVGRYTAVGEAEGGYFFLPPFTLWSDWARRELDVQRKRDRSIQVWINGRSFSAGNNLREGA